MSAGVADALNPRVAEGERRCWWWGAIARDCELAFPFWGEGGGRREAWRGAAAASCGLLAAGGFLDQYGSGRCLDEDDEGSGLGCDG